jgi:hypothetical protein
MATLDRFNRRTHLYAGMFFLPWFFVYGLSSVIFSHPVWFRKGPTQWNTLVDREYKLGTIARDADLLEIGALLVKEAGFDGPYVARRMPSGIVQVNQNRFLSTTQITYDPSKEHLSARRDVLRWTGVATRLHSTGGFEQPGFLRNLWSVFVDLMQVAILTWLCSGLYMWWKLRRSRNLGLLALACGVASFSFFLIGL